ncbi:dicarboxylate/amino acid:cation symporter [Salinibacter ruber]|jgi:proton glutamate symport protein|uniref:Na+/H+-dicarboxylate symporter n=1 Tax=Salinibacter ruber TaxID=146919 RepID=A0A9X3A697_9BACT|nr:dicarboxylate/amino acid:cation symporter [Salinibacter ruber]MBB4091330.1 Na+/H+-dicarboxylate symporter [Salinibacter ruber]MCS3611498.1 Na+/H+-dicarboxylate symporter [Salinibacter ruber]MCS3614989.1 Na+/H+-dicarboxylate symporter [Salinibacter ruber]MCS3626761.1 Na+/H+-dicarboxylate symporter [Salinibacter ruber]MCS3632602.1 Na+/H+-dicarboxylate symporter [Salinibacter ruber]
MPWYKKLHWQIIIGLVLGLVYGVVAASAGWGQFTSDWVAPFGTIFLNLLQLIAVPLILASLIVGVASLGDLEQLSRIGGKTLGIYILTTTIALVIGLVLVNTLQPGRTVPQEMRTQLEQKYQGDIEQNMEVAEQAEGRGPLQPLVDIVPSNFFESASDNGNMLQVVFVALFLGVVLLLLPGEKSEPLLAVFDSLFEAIIKAVEIIMLTAPVGVFGLLADAITSIAAESPADLASLLGALGFYCLTVVIGLAIMVFVVYPIFMRLFTSISIPDYFRAIAPAQLVAFSTSSSGGTLPVTMEVSEKNLGVSEQVSSFVLPLGATVNMDGTALYQAVSAVFIAQVLGISLAFTQQLNIVLVAVLASIGTAAVPSAGIVMLVVILESIGVPSAGLALILGVDRPLDMLRTTNNVTGDTMVASVVAATENQLNFPTNGVSVATTDVQGGVREETAR